MKLPPAPTKHSMENGDIIFKVGFPVFSLFPEYTKEIATLDCWIGGGGGPSKTGVPNGMLLLNSNSFFSESKDALQEEIFTHYNSSGSSASSEKASDIQESIKSIYVPTQDTVSFIFQTLEYNIFAIGSSIYLCQALKSNPTMLSDDFILTKNKNISHIRVTDEPYIQSCHYIDGVDSYIAVITSDTETLKIFKITNVGQLKEFECPILKNIIAVDSISTGSYTALAVLNSSGCSIYKLEKDCCTKISELKILKNAQPKSVLFGKMVSFNKLFILYRDSQLQVHSIVNEVESEKLDSSVISKTSKICTLPHPKATLMTLNSTGHLLAVGFSDTRVIIIDALSINLVYKSKLPLHGFGMTCLAFFLTNPAPALSGKAENSPKNNSQLALMSGSPDGTFRVSFIVLGRQWPQLPWLKVLAILVLMIAWILYQSSQYAY